MFGVRTLLILDKVLLTNAIAMQPAVSRQHCFSSGILNVCGGWDKWLNTGN